MDKDLIEKYKLRKAEYNKRYYEKKKTKEDNNIIKSDIKIKNEIKNDEVKKDNIDEEKINKLIENKFFFLKNQEKQPLKEKIIETGTMMLIPVVLKVVLNRISTIYTKQPQPEAQNSSILSGPDFTF